jgi:small Trp-rich protein
MAFLLIGLLLLALKLLELDPVAAWSWWTVAAPFGLAVAWWTFADASGLTKRREMRKLEERQAARREKAVRDMGMTPRRDPTGGRPRPKQDRSG